MPSQSQEEKELLKLLNRRPELKKRMRPKAESLRKSASWATRYLPDGRKAGLKNPFLSFRPTGIFSAAVKKIL